MRDQRGIAMPELLVGITAGMLVLIGVFMFSQATLRGSARVQQRVDATQRARPVLTHILDELHSACISPGIAPVLAGSSGTSMTFLHKTGTAVTPTPDKRTISLASGTLSESLYPYASGSAPDFVFSSVPTTTKLLTNVASGTVGGTTVPVFRYYAFNPATAVIDPTPLPVPLSQDDAERTVQVDVAFSSAPSKTRVLENNASLTVYDTVGFRFSPAAEDASQSQQPCT